MTPEEISFQENFLYPMYLLLIGGGLSVGLIKLFNFLHEIKLRKIEVRREEAQKRIDREREDNRISYEIKERLLEKDSERYTWFGEKFIELNRAYVIEKKKESELDMLFIEASNGLTMRNVPISNLIDLYIKDEKATDLNFELFRMMNSAFSIAYSEPNSEIRRNLLNEYLKKFNLNLTKDEIDETVASTSDTFEPVFLIARKSGDVTRTILKSKIAFHS